VSRRRAFDNEAPDVVIFSRCTEFIGEVIMRIAHLKRAFLAALLLLPVLGWAQPQELQAIKLSEPNKTRGLPVMQALSLRASVREWSDKDVTLQDLSDLLWAANGINRPDSKKRTAASAMNAQDIDIYVFRKDGAYLYDAANQTLNPVAAGDHREEIMTRAGGPGGPRGQKPAGAPASKPGEKPAAKPPMGPPSPAPVLLILVSDQSRFRGGSPEMKLEWGAIDTGIVSANISIFCAGTGMATRPRSGMNKEKIASLLKLTEAQHLFLNHPVGYPK
jgi:nitroreductase